MRFKDYMKLYEGVLDNLPENGFITDQKEVEDWCVRLNIWEGRTEIDEHGQVSVFGSSVRIDRFRLKRLPIKFKYVEKDFVITNSSLRSLLGCPDEVGSSFSCEGNRLRTLEHAPKKVGNNFNCSDNNLTNLKGCPAHIPGWFNAKDNELTTLEGGPKEVGEWCSVEKNDLTSLEHAPRKIGKEFSFRENDIESLEGIHKIIEECGALEGGRISRGGLGLVLIKNLTSLTYLIWDRSMTENDGYGWKDPTRVISKYLCKPNEIYTCQAELIENGYDAVAVL